MKLFLSLSIILFSFGYVVGQPMVTDRPDQTESSSTVLRKAIQIETGLVFEKDTYKKNGMEIESGTFNLATTLVRIGLTRRLEFRVGSEFTQVSEKPKDALDGKSGINGVYVGAKYKLRNEQGLTPEMAILFGANLPVGNQDIAPSKVQPIGLLAASHTLSNRIGLGYNLGAEVLNGDEVNFIYSAALGVELVEAVGAFIEIYGDKMKDTKLDALFDSGLTFMLDRNFQLDGSAGFALNEEALDWFINIGFSLRLFR